MNIEDEFTGLGRESKEDFIRYAIVGYYCILLSILSWWLLFGVPEVLKSLFSSLTTAVTGFLLFVLLGIIIGHLIDRYMGAYAFFPSHYKMATEFFNTIYGIVFNDKNGQTKLGEKERQSVIKYLLYEIDHIMIRQHSKTYAELVGSYISTAISSYSMTLVSILLFLAVIIVLVINQFIPFLFNIMPYFSIFKIDNWSSLNKFILVSLLLLLLFLCFSFHRTAIRNMSSFLDLYILYFLLLKETETGDLQTSFKFFAGIDKGEKFNLGVVASKIHENKDRFIDYELFTDRKFPREYMWLKNKCFFKKYRFFKWLPII
jgi:hypothetical protein